LSISAWEYAAPTTRLDSRVVFLGPFAGVGLRQNGEADLLADQRRVANAYQDHFLLGSVCGGAMPGCQSLQDFRVKRGRVKTYRLGPSPAARNTTNTPVSFRAESQACRTVTVSEGKAPTCGGGFLPLPEEEEENILAADDK
jgi:hypothetical protein